MANQLKSLIPALLVLLAVTPAVGLLAAGPDADAADVAVIFAPWSDDAVRLGKVAAADARLVRAGALSFIWVVRSDRPGLPGRLRSAGGLLLLDPRAAWGCAPPDRPV